MLTDAEFNRAAGRRLRSARKAAGLEAPQVGAALGLAASTVLGHENGSRGITPAQAARYALALRVTPAWLLFGDLAPMRSPDQILSSPGRTAHQLAAIREVSEA